MIELSEQELQRRQELREIVDSGINPYPYSWDVSTHAASVLRDFDDAEHQSGEDGETKNVMNVSMAGRIISKRVMGKAAFFNFRDSSGDIQGYVRRDDLEEGWYNTVFKKRIGIGDIVGIRGFAFRTKMGEVSIHVTEMQLLSKALRPLPIEKESDGKVFNEVVDKEFRYRQRYVDLILHQNVREVFKERARMVTSIRSFLDEREFVEVETPILQPMYGGATARPFTTHHNALDMPLYLRIADELYLKRLIVGGFDGVYEISKDFRNEGLSRFHSPEFTMLEVYAAYKDYEWMMDFVEQMVEHAVIAVRGTTEVTVDGTAISFSRPWKRIPMVEAILNETGKDIGGKSRDELAQIAVSLGMEVDSSMGAGKIIDEIFGDHVEPKLIQPTFITDYPIELSPLAKKHRSKAGLVERFEGICNGKEFCNAFSELNDPIDQRQRFEEQSSLLAAGDDEAMQIDEDYLRALEYGMPPTAGLGIGIDRLAMLLTGQKSVRDVILFPLLRPEQSGDEIQDQDEAETEPGTE